MPLSSYAKIGLAVLALAAEPAFAQSYDENPSGKPIYALADVRLTAANGETAWLDGGFGKARFGGDHEGGWRVRPRAVEADLAWQPHIGFALDATIVAIAQTGQEQPLDLSEAYLRYRHDPIGDIRVGGRLGLFWPPVSLEHSGPAWSVTETITPSAINSWIGEEVKVAGAEAMVSRPVGNGHVSATIALFGFNDTAGTLISFRGWALHDQKATAFSEQPLPPLNAFMLDAQAPATRPIIELDNRPGYYAALAWSSPRARLAAFYYDNRADPEAVDSHLQWGWRTRFAHASVQLKPGARTAITSQAMVGSTRMGYPLGDRIWVQTRFRSAFLLVSHKVSDASTLSARVEAFGTRAHGSVLGPETSEDGWAATLAGRYAIGEHVTLLAEFLHIDSRRQDRSRVLAEPSQPQTVLQLAARLNL